MAIVLGLGLRGHYAFNPPYLLLALDVLFFWGVTPFVAYISARSYLTSGSFTLLLVSLAFIVGVPFSIADGLSANSSPNVSVIFGALGLLFSSTMQLLGSAHASFGTSSIGSEKRKARLVMSYGLVFFISALVMVLALLPAFPPFFVQATGVTTIDQVVYSLVIAFFLVSGVLYLRLYLGSKNDILYMYALALLLFSIGSFGLTQQLVFGDVVVWIGRASLFAGTLYFLSALLQARTESSIKG